MCAGDAAQGRDVTVEEKSGGAMGREKGRKSVRCVCDPDGGLESKLVESGSRQNARGREWPLGASASGLGGDGGDWAGTGPPGRS